MSRLKRWAEIVVLVVLVPFACVFWGQLPSLSKSKSVFVYSGSFVAACMFSAVALPMLFGALSPREIVENYQSRRPQARFVRRRCSEELVGVDRYWSRRRRDSSTRSKPVVRLPGQR